MPSKKASKAELLALTPEQIEKGTRFANAWEVSLYSDGRQVVLPPSVHPDSGELYQWKRPLLSIKDLPVIEIPNVGEIVGTRFTEATRVSSPKTEALADFKVKAVDLEWLPISDEVRDAIVDGKGVEDRSGYLLKASSALMAAGLDRDEVLSVLTDPETFLGACAYDHAQTKDRGKAAAWAYRYTLAKVEGERDAGSVFKDLPIRQPKSLTPEEMEKEAASIAALRHWTEDLVKGGDKGQGPPMKLVQNVVLIMKNAVDQKVVKRDLFGYRDTYDCDTPWGGKKDAIISDDDVAKIKYWLSVHWGFEPSTNTISDALMVTACQNAYDPVKDLVGALPEWDGKARLDSWLKRHFEAKGCEEYLAQVFRKWMVAMILRVYEPGAKFDWMPIFEGAQGIGKSSFGRLLVGEKYFLDWLPNLNDKDSALSLQGMWGVEMGELSQFKRNELENIKAFITRTVDKLRPPYGRRLVESPRRCVFFGTTNRGKYLTDETGNRRFKPLIVGSLNFRALRRDRAQLFAEAKHLYLTKTETELSLELDGKAKDYERKIHNEKMVEDDSNAMADLTRIFIEKVEAKRVDFDLNKFRLSELFEGVGPLTKWKWDNRNSQFAAKMLTKLGGSWRFINGFKVWRVGGLEGTPSPSPKRSISRTSDEKDFY